MHARVDAMRAAAYEIRVLQSCVELLGWDEETYMPRAGATHRGEQDALLSGMARDKLADPRLAELCATVVDAVDVDEQDHADARELLRLHRRAARFPRALLEEQRRIQPLSVSAWLDARKARSAAALAPWLERIVDLKRDEAAILADDGDLYGALVDEYEPHMSSADVDALLSRLVPALIPLVDIGVARTERMARADMDALRGSFAADAQGSLSRDLAVALGFDLEGGRIDTTTHPFCSTIGPGDVRVATRFDPTSLQEGIYSTLHELGHALYEQGLPRARFGLPSGTASSLGLHESQSRLFENFIGRSAPFARFLAPMLRARFAGLRDLTPPRLHANANAIARTPHRVRADEVTYNLHIAVRVELERALIERTLSVADLKEAWSDAYQRVLGIRPTDDLDGVLQDGHWAAGMFGYFPTYTLGNAIAAQLWRALRNGIDDVDAQIERGRFEAVLAWLRARVHVRAGVSVGNVVADATGAPLDIAPLLAHLTAVAAGTYAV